MTILICITHCQRSVGVWAAWAVGPAYVSAALKEAGHNVINVNFIIEKRGIHEVLLEVMRSNNVNAVAVGDLVPHWERVKEITDAAKSINPNVITIIGGGLVTHSPKEAMELVSSADYGIIGEGEITACELIDALEHAGDVLNVPGIIYRNTKNGERGSELSTPREEIPDIDNLPFPDYDGFQFGELLTEGCASIVTSRSCPFSCTYCTHSGGKTFRMRSLDSVFEEIDLLVQKYGVKRLNLSDELFTVKTERLIEFCERIKPYDLKWRISLRISDNITLDLLRQMRDSGCVLILFGLESADNRILKSMRKGITVSQIKHCLELAKEAGIGVVGSFIFGDPEETMETVNCTLDWVNANRDLLVNINLLPINVYPGSQLYDDAVKNGKIKDPLEHIRGGCIPINISSMTDVEYDRLVGEIIPREGERLLQKSMCLSFTPNPETDEYKIGWLCPYCGKENEGYLKAAFTYKTHHYEISCSYCKSETQTNLAWEYIDYIKQKFFKIVRSCNAEKRIVLWGIGKFLKHIFVQIPELKECPPENAPFILCDFEKSKQGTQIYGHKVYAPRDALSKPGVHSCIITNMFYGDIKQTLAREYPGIEVIAAHEIGLGIDVKGASS